MVLDENYTADELEIEEGLKFGYILYDDKTYRPKQKNQHNRVYLYFYDRNLETQVGGNIHYNHKKVDEEEVEFVEMLAVKYMQSVRRHTGYDKDGARDVVEFTCSWILGQECLPDKIKGLFQEYFKVAK